MIGFRIEDKKSLSRFILHMMIFMLGAGLIYLVTSRFLTFGMKYLMMAPFMGLVTCLMLTHVNYKLVVLKMSLIFGVLMIMVSIYMTISMIISGTLTEVVLYLYKGKKLRPVIGGTSLACFTVTISLVVSKFMVGGVFEAISWLWVLLAFMISIILGLVGAVAGLTVGNIIHTKYKA